MPGNAAGCLARVESWTKGEAAMSDETLAMQSRISVGLETPLPGYLLHDGFRYKRDIARILRPEALMFPFREASDLPEAFAVCGKSFFSKIWVSSSSAEKPGVAHCLILSITFKAA